jgi:hypothetical protein
VHLLFFAKSDLLEFFIIESLAIVLVKLVGFFMINFFKERVHDVLRLLLSDNRFLTFLGGCHGLLLFLQRADWEHEWGEFLLIVIELSLFRAFRARNSTFLLLPDFTSIVLIAEAIVVNNEVILSSLLLDFIILIGRDFVEYMLNFINLVLVSTFDATLASLS